MYLTDQGIEELAERRGEQTVTLGWLADQLRTFVDLHPEFEVPAERLATWLARLDEDDGLGSQDRTGAAARPLRPGDRRRRTPER